MKIQKNTASIRIMVQPKFKERLQEKASEAGVGMSTYIKHVLLGKWEDIPVFNASRQLQQSLKEAHKDQKEGKLIPIEEVLKS